MTDDDRHTVVLSGSGLDVATLVRVARDPTVKITCDPAAVKRVATTRQKLEQAVETYCQLYADWQRDPTDEDKSALLKQYEIYGVTTGFGDFKRVAIDPAKLCLLQKNILFSHAVGVGSNRNPNDLRNYFDADVVRATLVLRLNSFLRGHSGVRVAILEYLTAMLNRGIIPLVPTRGSVGSSGDLCPLSHLFVTLLGHGRYYRVATADDIVTPPSTFRSADEQLDADLQMPRYEPSFKEGLALTNGASFSAAALALAVYDAERLANTADIAAGLTFEAMCGRTRCLDEKVHAARGLAGQADSAANIRDTVLGGQWLDRAYDVQDAYSLRCAPPVHGASRDAVSYAKSIIEREINATTDNPLFLDGVAFDDRVLNAKSGDARQADEQQIAARDNAAYSAGNFHGQPIALAADFLAIAVAELANISERRTQMMLDKHHNRGLPAGLAWKGGLQSGYLIAQYCAAGLVSENKVLTHPASVDSVPTSANTEDHNSMATIAARKLLEVIGLVESTLAIELMCAAQACDWRLGVGIAPPQPGALNADPDDSAEARAERFERVTSDAVARQLGVGSRSAYQVIRKHVATLRDDRPLDGDVLALRNLIHGGELTDAVAKALTEAGRSLRHVRRLEFGS